MSKVDDDLPPHEEVWNNGDDDELFSKIKPRVPWDDVAFGNHTANDCRNRFEEYLKSVQQQRQQIVTDVEGNPKEILTSFRLFVQDQRSKVKLTDDFVETIIHLQTLYDSLSPKQYAIYMQKAKDLGNGCKSNATLSSSRNGRKNSHPPKKPRALFYEYSIATGTETNRKILSQMYENMSKQEKYEWICLSIQRASTANPVSLSQKEQEIWNNLGCKKPPTGYNMFVKEKSAENKIEEIAEMWKRLDEKQLQIYNDAARAAKNRMIEAEIAQKEKLGILSQKKMKSEVETPDTPMIEPIMVNENPDVSVTADPHVDVYSNSHTENVSKEIKEPSQNLSNNESKCQCDETKIEDQRPVELSSNLSNTKCDCQFIANISKEIKVQPSQNLSNDESKCQCDETIIEDQRSVELSSNLSNTKCDCQFIANISKEIKVQPSQNLSNDESKCQCDETIIEDQRPVELSSNLSNTKCDCQFIANISKEIKVQPSQNLSNDESKCQCDETIIEDQRPVELSSNLPDTECDCQFIERKMADKITNKRRRLAAHSSGYELQNFHKSCERNQPDVNKDPSRSLRITYFKLKK